MYVTDGPYSLETLPRSRVAPAAIDQHGSSPCRREERACTRSRSMSTGTYEAAVLDLDGTVYLGDSLIPEVDTAIQRLRETVGPVRFLTNKAIARRQNYTDKLRRFGIDVDLRHVVNSGWVTAQYVSDRYPDSTALVVGESPLIEEFQDAGVDTTTETPGDLVVASMDRTFDYDDLHLALRTLDGGAPFLATNPDRTCPTESGAIPDAAGMIGAIEGVTGWSVDEVLGKPSPRMIEITLTEVGVDPAKCLMVGDRVETDILMGDRVGMTTVLVLSGVTDREMVPGADTEPDYVLDSLAEIDEVLDDR